ncbi:MAG: hypothetical protein WD467_00010 [Candidatus Saccharimonadales bacterium]
MSIDRDPCEVLKDSVKDPENGEYLHSCGSIVQGKLVYLSILGRYGLNSAGQGEVVNVVQACCPPCGIEPSTYGSIKPEDTPTARDDDVVEGI